MNDVRLDTNFVDYLIVASYFVVVLGVGFAAKRYIKSSLDYFLSGRSLPAWITGLAFISANLGATEVLGMAANGAQYGIATVNYYWIGAIPAMVFLGLVMMPFYYGSKIRSVPKVSTITDTGWATPIAYATCTSHLSARPAATTFFAT